MSIYHQLETTHSKESSLKIISYIGNDEIRFKELMDCFFMETGDYRVPQRAAHVVSLTFDKNPELIHPYIPELIQYLQKKDLKDALKRNILRVLQFCEIEESLRGILYNRSFEMLENPKEEIAIRAFSITVLFNLTQYYPELKSELQLMIETVLEEPGISPGVLSRGKKTLMRLKKE